MDWKQSPTETWIADIRRRMPVDPAIDRVLTRKLRNRAGPSYQLLSIVDVSRRLDQFLKSRLGSEPFVIGGLKRLTGGASKEQFVFDLQCGTTPPQKMVLRADPAESVADSNRGQEFNLMRLMGKVVPVPPVYWVDEDGADFGQPCMIAGFVSGVTKPKTGAQGNVSGLGSVFSAEWRERLKYDFVRNLAVIHKADWQGEGLEGFQMPRPGTTESAEASLNWQDRLWEEDGFEEVPLIRAAGIWLRENMPVTDRVSVVHGDYRSGNFLFDESSGKVTAILDWELGHLGDRHHDLGYALQRSVISSVSETGELLASGLISRDEFLDRYEEYSGEAVDMKRLRYYEILNARKSASAIATGLRAAVGGKMHINMVGVWIASMGYQFFDDLRMLLDAEG